MILLDFNQCLIGALAQELNRGKAAGGPTEFSEDMFRHIALNMIRSYRVKFTKDEFGELVLCCDKGRTWRRTVFPYYKQTRKRPFVGGMVSMTEVFDCFNSLRQDLVDHFPYRVMLVDGAEADDIIAVLTKYESWKQSILILSTDEDFLQLQSYPGVRQYAPSTKKFLTVEDPREFLKEKIIRGDRGDGIPNIFSDPDSLYTEGKRQTQATDKKVYRVVYTDNPQKVLEHKAWMRYCENEQLISFDKIPREIEEAVLNAYAKSTPKAKPGAPFYYLLSKRLRMLAENAADFG